MDCVLASECFFAEREAGMRKHLWVIGGTVSLGLGILGIFLPVLPTTPFLLLAAFCYGRGSERFYNWLVNRSRIGGYIRDYREGRGIPLKQKLLTVALLWVTIGFTIGFVATTWWLKALLVVVAAGVTIHLIKIKTWRPESPGLADKENSMESIEVS
jgi:uncharacterized membrane protein YbaN (DUF454 family)